MSTICRFFFNSEEIFKVNSEWFDFKKAQTIVSVVFVWPLITYTTFFNNRRLEVFQNQGWMGLYNLTLFSIIFHLPPTFTNINHVNVNEYRFVQFTQNILSNFLIKYGQKSRLAQKMDIGYLHLNVEFYRQF